MIEHMLAARYENHAEDHQLFPALQYRRFQSTETAVTVVHSDLVHAVDDGRVTALSTRVISEIPSTQSIIRCYFLLYTQGLESTDWRYSDRTETTALSRRRFM